MLGLGSQECRVGIQRKQSTKKEKQDNNSEDYSSHKSWTHVEFLFNNCFYTISSRESVTNSQNLFNRENQQ